MNSTNPTPDSQASAPDTVAEGLARVAVERVRLVDEVVRTDLDRAVRAELLAVLWEREARWWGVLVRWTYSAQTSVPVVFGPAVITARGEARSRARFYRDAAADHRRRAAGQPVCAVLGCDCGGTCELNGVAA